MVEPTVPDPAAPLVAPDTANAVPENNQSNNSEILKNNENGAGNDVNLGNGENGVVPSAENIDNNQVVNPQQAPQISENNVVMNYENIEYNPNVQNISGLAETDHTKISEIQNEG